ncbi:50S ribosomal protein L4 [Candidatus Wolfebacteria bacterium]|nr:MAG: 50S ribosomal protein L4 [Candidatus Wolfebacteria bacterium]
MAELKAKIYSKDGTQEGDITLPEYVFDVPWNADLVHQVVVGMNSNKRAGTAHTKDRSDVSGTGAKPWRQKGTGRARHGSRRSPIWRTGGVAHGPLNTKDYSKKINKKMRAKALYAVLSEKFRNGEILFVNDISLEEAKTKNAQKIIASLGKVSGFEKLPTSRKKIAHFTMSKKDENVSRGFKNIPQISMGSIQTINPVEILQYNYLVITNPEESVNVLSARLSKSSSTEPRKKTGNKISKKKPVRAGAKNAVKKAAKKKVAPVTKKKVAPVAKKKAPVSKKK